MKVILTRDVAKLGRRHSIAEVPDGYALNKLIPSGMALAATPENLKKVKAHTEKQVSDKITEVAEFKIAVAALKESPVVIKVDANAQDHLFKAVKASDIAQALASAGHPIPVDAIKLSEPIKALGEYQIPVALGDAADVITISIQNK
ncbi:50S ribosomal protein L9 [Patescibacteria group bacterium]|nr:50S ribosomal protein L9 [Patescibacteria group bacterium]